MIPWIVIHIMDHQPGQQQGCGLQTALSFAVYTALLSGRAHKLDSSLILADQGASRHYSQSQRIEEIDPKRYHLRVNIVRGREPSTARIEYTFAYPSSEARAQPLLAVWWKLGNGLHADVSFSLLLPTSTSLSPSLRGPSFRSVFQVWVGGVASFLRHFPHGELC